MAENRPAIPAPIKREVRQRCGFGCVICGFPIYEFEHFEEWHLVERHDPSEMTLLCSKHHDLKTRKLITKEKIIEANSKPYNIVHGISSPYNIGLYGNEIKVQIGSIIATNTDKGDGAVLIPLMVDSVPIIFVKLVDNQIFFSFKLYDKHGNIILNIEENEILFKSKLWDIELKKNRLIFREAARKILLELELFPPNLIKLTKGNLYCKGKVFKISEKHGFNFGENNMKTGISNMTLIGSLIISIGENNTGLIPMITYKKI